MNILDDPPEAIRKDLEQFDKADLLKFVVDIQRFIEAGQPQAEIITGLKRQGVSDEASHWLFMCAELQPEFGIECPYCSKQIKPDSKVCPYCRHLLQSREPAKRDKPKRKVNPTFVWLAALVLLGVAGWQLWFGRAWRIAHSQVSNGDMSDGEASAAIQRLQIISEKMSVHDEDLDNLLNQAQFSGVIYSHNARRTLGSPPAVYLSPFPERAHDLYLREQGILTNLTAVRISNGAGTIKQIYDELLDSSRAQVACDLMLWQGMKEDDQTKVARVDSMFSHAKAKGLNASDFIEAWKRNAR